MSKVPQVVPVTVTRAATASKQAEPVDSHSKLSFALPPQLLWLQTGFTPDALQSELLGFSDGGRMSRNRTRWHCCL